MRLYLLLGFWLATASAAFGQQGQSLFNALTKSSGLSETTHSFVFRDSRGFVWLSSLDGLNRYDGRRVRVYSPQVDNPHAIMGKNVQSPFFEDTEGDLWFGTEQAICCYRHKTERFEHFFLGTGGNRFYNAAHYAFHLDDNRHLWVIAGDTLFKLNTRQSGHCQAVAPLPKAVRCAISVSDSGVKNLFVAFWGNGPGFEWLSFDAQDRLQGRRVFLENSQTICHKVLCDSRGDAWFASNEGLLGFSPQGASQPKNFPLPAGKGMVRSIARFEDDRLLCVSTTGELWQFDTQLHRFEALGSVYALIDGEKRQLPVRGANVNADQLAWLTLPGEGVFYARIQRGNFTRMLEKGASNHSRDFSQLAEDPAGRIWAMSYKDPAIVFDKESGAFQSITAPAFSVLFENQFKVLQWLSPEVIANTELDNNIIRLGPKLPQINSLAVPLGNATMLIGTVNGLFIVNEKNGVAGPVDFYRSGVATLFKDAQNRIWVGGFNQLDVFDLSQGIHAAKLIKRFEQTGSINHVAQDLLHPEMFWVGTTNGLLRLDASANWSKLSLGEQEGLPSALVQSVVPDRQGRIWLGTNKGIVRYQPEASQGERFRCFDRRNGLSSNEYCKGAALLDSTGKIWFAGKNGIDRFVPNAVRDIGAAPQLVIVGLKIHEHDWPGEQSIETARRIDLEYNQNTLRLELAALEYTDPSMNEFKVRLLNNGSDTSWVKIGTQNFITYPNLRPGNYRFQFKACNAEGVWQETPRSLEIVIHPHFTDTLWFRILLITSVLAFIGFFIAAYFRYQLRAQQLELEKQQREAERKQLILENELSLQQERNRIADEMHDELGGGLSTIRLASQRAKRITSPEELQGILGRVSQISIGLVNNMRGIIWAMDSQNDSLVSLLAYIRQYAGTFLDDNAIAATLRLPDDYPDRPLSSHYRHSIMLTVKECLNNILKHANASAVEVSVNIGDVLCILIRDNGKGFEPEAHVGKGKGLRTTVKRMESIGGSILWQRNADSGMTATLCAPLPLLLEDILQEPGT